MGETGTTNAASQLLNVAFSLLLIIGLILALAWLLRRFGQGNFLNQQSMKIMASMPLGTRERLLVVEVGGQQILLGVTSHQINTLHVFDEPVVDASGGTSTDFKKRLMALMNRAPASDTPAPETQKQKPQ
ncbi:flagellar biosynthetic protein FliO [Marinimicrobium agarilyticum]|uniref:flagellar biosynthetic protein FliO n=1 Tax=Marinimicrobium agarilyticum TaxID=306546 RepID=UPI0003F79AA4|nr:flagellar biosynthetic protein FliO [Marinimicrobium agarilyticum]